MTHGAPPDPPSADAVLVVGEALVDVVRRHGTHDTERPGGSPANVALGLARLGRPVDLLTHLGDDGRGGTVRRWLDDAGVRLVPGSTVPGPTSTALAVIAPDGDARYEFDLRWHLPHPPDPTGWAVLHTGSVATFIAPGADPLLALVERARGRMGVTYDPNVRPALMGDPRTALARVERFVAAADVVKASDDDLAWLDPGDDPVRTAARWLGLGPALVVVTHGAGGATAVCRAGRVHVPAPPTVVVDTVGAGDSCMAALVDHLLRTGRLGPTARADAGPLRLHEVRAALEFCTRAAAVTCSRVGADPPTRGELDG